MSEELICTTADVAPGAVAAFSVAGKDIALIHTASDRWFAVVDRCSHGRFKLSNGLVSGQSIECTRHGAVFNLEDGSPQTPPATTPVQTYPVRVADDQVYVEL